MYNLTNDNRDVSVSSRYDIGPYIRAFRGHMRRTRGRVYNLRLFGEAEEIQELINYPEHRPRFAIPSIEGDDCTYDQQVTFVSSNLGLGYIFYFLCSGCGRRVRYLYELSAHETPLCRTCCRIDYDQPNRQARSLSRLLRKPYLETEDKRVLIKHLHLSKNELLLMAQNV